MITNNQITKPTTQTASTSQKQKMNEIVNRIVELIKEKHL
jgi:hypothetical protein